MSDGWTAAAVAATSADDWSYLCEGGNNVVLRYSGPASPLVGSVLRLGKAAVAVAAQPLPQGPPALQVLPSDPVAFVATVMAPLLAALGCPGALLPAACLSPGLPQPWLRAVDARLLAGGAWHAARAPHRRSQGLSLSPGAPALLQADGGHAPPSRGCRVLCIEIKPKWGLPPRQAGQPCRFCMQQLGKAAAAATAAAGAAVGGAAAAAAAATAGTAAQPPPSYQHSLYCPLDLFSGSPPRVQQALRALAATPQNNFRVFEHGQLLHGQEAGAGSLQLALAPLPAEQLLGALAEALCAPTCPLGALLALQGLSAAAGEELGAVGALASLQQQQPGSSGSSSVQGLVEGLQGLLRGESVGALSSELALAAFLVSASAKDASLLVRVLVDEGGRAAGESQCWLIDLDPKPPSRVGKYAAQAKELQGLWEECRGEGGAAACSGLRR